MSEAQKEYAGWLEFLELTKSSAAVASSHASKNAKHGHKPVVPSLGSVNMLHDLYFPRRQSSEQSQDIDFGLLLQEETKHDVQRGAFWYILNCCISELLMVECGNTPTTKFPMEHVTSYLDLLERFGDLDKFGKLAIGEEYTDLHKLQKEINTVISLLEVCASKEFYPGLYHLEGYLSAIKRMGEDDEELIKTYQYQKQVYRELEEEYVTMKITAKKRNIELDEQIVQKLSEYKELAETSIEKPKLVEKWEASRQEQNKMILNESEQKHARTVKKMSHNITMENICHEHVDKFCEQARLDYLDEIEQMMKTYDADMERKDLDILIMKNRIEKLIDDKEACQLRYEKRQQEMEDFREYKRLKKLENIILKTQTSAATKIQGWWREIMIRNCLGPYRKKKGKKNDKKKAAKK